MGCTNTFVQAVYTCSSESNFDSSSNNFTPNLGIPMKETQGELELFWKTEASRVYVSSNSHRVTYKQQTDTFV